MGAQRLKVTAVAALLAVLAMACSGEGAADGGNGSASGQADFTEAYRQVRESYHHMFATADGLAGAIAEQKDLGETTSMAIDARASLNEQLGEHAFLAIFAMQKGLDGAEDFDASSAALDDNSVALGATFGSLYGERAGDTFLKQWRDHIRMLVDFTVGTATNDAGKRNAALRELEGYSASFAKFLTENTGLAADTGLGAEAVSGLLRSHVMQLTTALDTYKAKRYDLSYKQARDAYGHMFTTGDGLSGAIAKQKALGDPTGQAADMRVALDRLLGEHAMLAVFAMQKGADSEPDFEAIAASLDKNTVDLANTIGSVYDKPARDAFLKQWRDHIRMFVDFTIGTATDDDAKRRSALEELSAYKTSFAEFLTERTGLSKDAGLDAGSVAGLLQAHVDQLTSALDAFLGRSA